MNKSRKSSGIILSLLWVFLERTSVQSVNLIVQIILARVIAPVQFGNLAVLIVFINISSIFIQKGFSVSLIRKKSVDELDLNSAFWTSLIVAVIIYLIFFAAAPFVASIYDTPVLSGALRIISLSILLSSLYCVQNAILVRNMKFRIIFVRGLIASVFSGGLGIVMAYRGLGLWALVAQNVSHQLLLCIIVWGKTQWKPRFEFSIERIKEIFDFGGKLLLSEIVVYSVESLRPLLIGKKYSAQALSYYDRGHTYPAYLMQTIYTALSNVFLPFFSKKQDETQRLAFLVEKIISVTFFITTPLLIGIAAVSKPLVSLLLTDKWLLCIPYLIIFCIYQIPYPIQGIARQVLYAKGKSDYVLYSEIFKGILVIVLLALFLNKGVWAIAVSSLISAAVSAVINLALIKIILPVGIGRIIKTLAPTMFHCAVMSVPVWACGLLRLNSLLTLIIQIFVGLSVYCFSAAVFKDKNLKVIIGITTDSLKTHILKKTI